MNYKKNIRYLKNGKFRSASYVLFTVATISLAIIIFLGSWMGDFSRLAIILLDITWVLAPIAAIAGVVCFLLSTSDREYDVACASLIEPFKKYFIDQVTESMNKKASFGRVFQSPDLSRLSLSAFYSYEDGVLRRRGHDGKNRSSEYVLTACLFDKGRLFIGYQVNGMTHDKRDEFFGAFKLEDINSIDVTRAEDGDSAKKYGRVCIDLKNADPITFYQTDDAEFDRIVKAVTAKLTAN